MFEHPEDLTGVDEFRRGLPYMNTCGLSMHLLVLNDDDVFQHNMMWSLKHSVLLTCNEGEKWCIQFLSVHMFHSHAHIKALKLAGHFACM